jgi:DNA mismatch repair protein MutH
MKPLRTDVLEKLRKELPGRNLYALAELHQIPIYFGTKKNKGWVGQTIEKAGGLVLTSDSHRDGEDFELKTTCVVKRGFEFVPKETIKITQLNPQKILEEEFFQSTLWQKLERWLLVTYWFPEPGVASAHQLLSVDFRNAQIVTSVKTFWEDVRNAVCCGEMRGLINLGSSRDYIQLRPLGDGKQMSVCPVTGESFPARAFYATKRLILSLMSEEAL